MENILKSYDNKLYRNALKIDVFDFVQKCIENRCICFGHPVKFHLRRRSTATVMLLRAVAEKNEHMWPVCIETEEIEYAVFQAKPARCPKTCTKPSVTRSFKVKCVRICPKNVYNFNEIFKISFYCNFYN